MRLRNRQAIIRGVATEISTVLGLATALQISLALGDASPLAPSSTTLSVSAQMDIWQAGGNADGSDGEPPAVYSFSATPGQVLTFSSVTGIWSCSFIAQGYGPDGTTGPCANPGTSQDIGPVGPFSGSHSIDFTGALVGMFLEDVLPSSAPPTLTFYFNDSSQGGIQTNFTTLSPQIGQVFFIGDGLTGTGTGAVQVFNIPSTATHLYLGFVDACSHVGSGVPDCYHDNVGSMSTALTVSSMPEPDTLLLTAPIVGLWLTLCFRRQRRAGSC